MAEIHDGTFIINDIELTISPENISIDRAAQVKQYQPIRTKGTAKVRSPSSNVSITVQAKFVGVDDINNKLRPLVAQFLLTPFCYVENQYIRDTMLGHDHSSENMALALQNLTISTIEGLPFTWNVVFSFTWFNYKPYTRGFFFKNELFNSSQKNMVGNPGLIGNTQLSLFQHFYQNQLQKLKPVSLDTSDIGFASLEFLLASKSPNPDVLDDSVVDFDQLEQFESESLDILDSAESILTDLGTDNVTVDQLRQQLAQSQSSDPISTVQSTVAAIATALNTVKGAKPNNNQVNQLLKKQNELLKSSSLIFKQQVWLEFPSDATRAPNEFRNKNGSTKLYYRGRVLSTENSDFHSGLVATSITMNFSHKLAMMPLQGYQYPTAQHLGSSDIEFNVQLVCLDDESNRQMADFWNLCQNNLQYGKFISQDLTTVQVFNELFSFVGVETILLSAKRDVANAGGPNLYKQELVCVENQLFPIDIEAITSVPTSFNSVRKKIWRDIFNNIQNGFINGFKDVNDGSRVTFKPVGNLDENSKQFLTKLILSDITLLNSRNGLNLQAGVLFDKLFNTKQVTLLSEKNPRNIFLLTAGLKDDQVLGIEGLNDFFYRVIMNNPSPKFNDLRFSKDDIGNTEEILRANQLALNNRLAALRQVQEAKTLLTSTASPLKTVDSNLVATFQDGSSVDIASIITDPNIQQEMKDAVNTSLTQSQQQHTLTANGQMTAAFIPNFNANNLVPSTAGQILFVLEKLEHELITLEADASGGKVKDPILFLFTGWVRYAADTADEIIDKYLNLPIFKDAKKEYDEFQKKTKKSLYSDMKFGDIADTVKNNLHLPGDVQLEPDFYFWNETPDQGTISSLTPEVVGKIKSSTLQYEQNVSLQNKKWYQDLYLKKANPELRAFLDKSNPKGEFQQIDSGLQPTPGLTQLSKDIPAVSKGTNGFTKDLKGTFSVNTNQATSPITPRTQQQFTEVLNIAQQPMSASDDTNQTVGQSLNPGKVVAAYGGWIAPLKGDVQISSTPGNRANLLTNIGGHSQHNGTDLIVLAGGQNVTQGQEVFSSLDGEVFQTFFEANGGGWNIGIRSQVEPWGEVRCKYLHLMAQAGTNFPGDLKIGDTVTAGQRIGYAGSTGASTGPHLHFEVDTGSHGQYIYPFGSYRGDEVASANPDYIVQDLIPISGGTSNGYNYLPHAGLQGINAGMSALDISIKQLQANWNRSSGYRMGRAYPSVYMAFIEEDLDDERIYKFDDYFSFASMVSIYCVKDREVPADYVYMTLTNISGLLSNRKFQGTFNENNPVNSASRGQEALKADVRRDPSKVNTDEEFKFESLLLREGIKVELRMGYSNDPDNLEVVFVGRIVGTQFSESDDIIDVEMQSLATELVQDIKGLDKVEVKDGFFMSDARTGPLLETLIASPECVSFGFWKRGMRDGNTDRGLLTSRFTWNPEPSSDNIFAPPSDHLDPHKFLAGDSLLTKILFGSAVAAFTGGGAAFVLGSSLPTAAILGITSVFGATGTTVFGGSAIAASLKSFFGVTGDGSVLDKVTKGIFSALSYYLYQTTIWDVFKEMEHRHPDCIASPVPYIEKLGGRTRMTMFFGNPDWLYFARDPTGENKAKTQEILDRTASLKAALKDRTVAKEDKFKALTEFADATQLSDDIVQMLPGLIAKINDPDLDDARLDAIDKAVDNLRLTEAINNSTITPFRRYHVVTSSQHIIANNIRAKSTNTFNAVTINYASSDEKVKIDGNNGPHINDVEEMTLKLDALIPDELTREAVYTYPNCQGDLMAVRYAVSHLQKGCWGIYQGDLVILGNPSIRPYDIVFIYDEYSDIYGAVQVRRVTHMFDYEHGFITVITPDLLTTVTEGVTLSHMFAMGLMAERLLGFENVIEKLPSQPDIGDGVVSPWKLALGNGALGVASFFGMKKLLFVTQFGHPIRVHPLIHNGQAMVAGFGPPGIRENEFFINDVYQWFLTRSRAVSESWEDFKRMWDNREGILNTRGNILETLSSTGGTDFTALSTGRKK